MQKPQNIAERLRKLFNLEDLPVEGGLFAQTYQSPEQISRESLPERYAGGHPFGSAILYLLNRDLDCFSALHRLPTDEIWHFYLGDPVEMLLLFPDGHSQRVVLGQDVFNGQKVQFVAPHGVWQGTRLLEGGEYALLGTTLAPGYGAADYSGGSGEELARQYPQEADLIRRLTRPG